MVLGIDIGATKTWIARLVSGVLHTSEKIMTKSGQTPFLDDLYELIEDFCGRDLKNEDDCMINPIREILPRIAYFEEHRSANIQKAQLWDDAVLYGAVSLFNQ